MKKVYCANCGQELLFLRKASKSQQKIYDMVEPHTCEKDIKFNLTQVVVPRKISTSDAESGFKFVQKLNELDKKLEVEPKELSDKRTSEFVKDFAENSSSFPSTAPENILKTVKH